MKWPKFPFSCVLAAYHIGYLRSLVLFHDTKTFARLPEPTLALSQRLSTGTDHGGWGRGIGKGQILFSQVKRTSH